MKKGTDVCKNGFCCVCDLPDEILEVVFRNLRGKQRVTLARVCKQMKLVHDGLPWRYLSLSTQRLFRRGRYCEVPHWTADFVLAMKLLQTNKFLHLRTFQLFIDSPCFDSTKSAWWHPEYAAKYAHITLPSVKHLTIIVQRHNYAMLDGHCMTRFVRCFNKLSYVKIEGIKNISAKMVHHLFSTDTIETMCIRNCSLTRTAIGALRQKLQGTSTAWPASLQNLTLVFHQMVPIIRSLNNVPDPFNAISRLHYIDMSNSVIFMNAALMNRICECANIIVIFQKHLFDPAYWQFVHPLVHMNKSTIMTSTYQLPVR